MPNNEYKDKPIQVSRVVNAGPEAVYAAFTESDKVKKWFGPKDFTCPFFKSDLRVGGKYLSAMRSPEGKDFWSTGSYKEIVPNKKLVYSDCFSDKDGKIVSASEYGMNGDWPLECEISVTLAGLDEQTTVTLVHKGIPASEQADCMKSWEEAFDKLDASVSHAVEPRISYQSHQSSSYNAPSPL